MYGGLELRWLLVLVILGRCFVVIKYNYLIIITSEAPSCPGGLLGSALGAGRAAGAVIWATGPRKIFTRPSDPHARAVLEHFCLVCANEPLIKSCGSLKGTEPTQKHDW